MTFLTKTTFHGVERTPELEQAIADRITKLERLTDRIVDCRVAVETHSVHVDLHLPKTVVNVTKKEAPDLMFAVRDAFDAVERAVRERPRRIRVA